MGTIRCPSLPDWNCWEVRLLRWGGEPQEVDHRIDAFDPFDAALDLVDLLLGADRTAHVDDPINGVDVDLVFRRAAVAKQCGLNAAGHRLIALDALIGTTTGQ